MSRHFVTVFGRTAQYMLLACFRAGQKYKFKADCRRNELLLVSRGPQTVHAEYTCSRAHARKRSVSSRCSWHSTSRQSWSVTSLLNMLSQKIHTKYTMYINGQMKREQVSAMCTLYQMWTPFANNCKTSCRIGISYWSSWEQCRRRRTKRRRQHPSDITRIAMTKTKGHQWSISS